MELEGAVTLVTGGTKGLGLGIALHLEARGAVVATVDIDAMAIAALPAGITGHVADVTNPDAVKAVVGAVVERHGRIDVLVNNAGVIFNEPLAHIMNSGAMMHDYERFRRSIVANLDSVFIATSAVVERMVMSRTKGVIVNISSISARGNEGQTAEGFMVK